MPTPEFMAQFRKAEKKNNLLTYEQKEKIWAYDIRDWRDGKGEHGYEPHKPAQRFHKSLARVRSMCTGNRFGKTTAGAEECEAYITIPGTTIWVLGETYDICNREWDCLLYGLTKTPLWYKYIKPEIEKQMAQVGIDKRPESFRKIHSSSPKRIEINWPNAPSSVIVQKQYGKVTGGGTSLEGEELTGVLWPEGSRIPEQIYDRNVSKRLSDRWGWEILPFTPKGKANYPYNCFLQGLSQMLYVNIDWDKQEVIPEYKGVEKHPNHVDITTSYWDSYETWQYPGYARPGYNIETYHSDVKKLFNGKLSEQIFRERNFGTFEAMSGNYFIGVDFEAIFVDSYPLPKEGTHFRSVDPGRAGAACCLWVDILPDETVIVYDELYKGQTWANEFARMMKEKTQHPIQFTAGDREMKRQTHHSKLSMLQEYKNEGIDPLYTPRTMPNSIIERLDFWKPKLHKKKIIIFKDRCPNLCAEMETLEYAEQRATAGRLVKKEELANTPKHAIDCLTYLFWCYPSYKAPKVEVIKDIPDESVFDLKAGYQEGSFMDAWHENKNKKQSIGLGKW